MVHKDTDRPSRINKSEFFFICYGEKSVNSLFILMFNMSRCSNFWKTYWRTFVSITTRELIKEHTNWNQNTGDQERIPHQNRLRRIHKLYKILMILGFIRILTDLMLSSAFSSWAWQALFFIHFAFPFLCISYQSLAIWFKNINSSRKSYLYLLVPCPSNKNFVNILVSCSISTSLSNYYDPTCITLFSV